MKVLYITYGLPCPPESGAKLHDFHLIRRIARWAEVYVCSLVTTPSELGHLPHLRQMCQGIEWWGSWQRPAWRLPAAMFDGFRSGRPLAMTPFYHPELARKVRSLIQGQHIDLLQIEHSILAGYRHAVPAGHPCRTILSFHNVAARQYRLMAQVAGCRLLGWAKAWLMRNWEADWASRFDHCLTVSPQDRALLVAENPLLPITVIDNGVDTTALAPLPPPARGNDLLFVGAMGYPPNADAARWLCREVLPLVRREVVDARLLVVGHAPPAWLRALHDGRQVMVTGSVPDVQPHYQTAQLSLAPLRAGSGTRLKILEAFALGRPVVSTTLGCEGLAVEAGVHLEVADTPAAFALAIVHLLRDRRRAAQLVRQARQLVEERYDWSEIARRLYRVYEGLLRQPARGAA